jgi:ribosome-binding protein aMBF1 (putative translation factor)
MSRRIVLASQSIWLMGASQYWDTTWTAWRAFTPNPPKRHEDLLRSHSVEYTQLMSMLNRSHSFVNERAAEHCRLRTDKGWSQEELAFRAKVDRSYISQLETGVYSASVTMLGKLSKALGVDASELLKS